MNRYWVAGLSIIATTVIACANLSGLSDLELDQPRTIQIDGNNGADAGSHDAEGGVRASRDATSEDATSHGEAAREDGPLTKDAPADGSSSDTWMDTSVAEDGHVESGSSDSASRADGSDANQDGDPDSSGSCGPTTTIENCGACGVACDTTTATSEACDMGACAYVCKPGRSDCDTSGSNVNGCECATPGCCGDSCETAHFNGMGQTFYDCAPKNTFDQSEATAACAAYAGSSSACAVVACSLSGAAAVCSSGSATSCVCWEYAGANAGRVQDAKAAGPLACECPSAASPTWD